MITLEVMAKFSPIDRTDVYSGVIVLLLTFTTIYFVSIGVDDSVLIIWSNLIFFYCLYIVLTQFLSI